LLIPHLTPKTRKSWPRFYYYTDKGSMTQTLWGELITQLMKILNETRRYLPVLLLCDHPPVHDNVSLWDLLHKQNTTVMFFPHHSSHISQPLDRAPFAKFKRVARLLQHDIVASRILSNDQKSELRSYVEIAEGETFRSKTIIAGFVQHGIFPFSPETIEANMRNILPPLKEETPSGQNSLLIETLSGSVKPSKPRTTHEYKQSTLYLIKCNFMTLTTCFSGFNKTSWSKRRKKMRKPRKSPIEKPTE